MRLKRVRVQNYRSILDSGYVDVDPELACIVGETGSGKTSFLQMISGIDDNATFSENALPRALVAARPVVDLFGKAPQLDASLEVEEQDRLHLPAEYRHIREVRVRRAFGGKTTVTTVPDYPAGADAGEDYAERAKLRLLCEQMAASFARGAAREPSLAPDKDGFESGLQDLACSKMDDLKETGMIIRSLRNTINEGRADDRLWADFAKWDGEVGRLLSRARELAGARPEQQLAELIPKPRYSDGPFELEAEASLDEFMADPSTSETFRCIALITDMTPSSLQQIRSASSGEREAYFAEKSRMLSERFNESWRQGNHDLRVELDHGKLRLAVRDEATGTETSAAERSAGFKWWTAFFLETSAFMTGGSGRQLLLLDDPAMHLHGGAKADALRFLADASRSGRLQVVYSTHDSDLVPQDKPGSTITAELARGGSKFGTQSAPRR